MELPHTNQNTGIDLGIKELCITSEGKKYVMPAASLFMNGNPRKEVIALGQTYFAMKT